jgi:drug/metabolite transporter (DMT)-like permease
MWFMLAFGSAVLSATASIAEKKTLFRMDALTFSFLLAAVLMVYSLGTMFVVDVTAVTSATLVTLILKGIVNAFAFLLVMMALQRAEISSTLPLLALTPGIVALLAYFTIGDTISAREIIGLVLMIGGMVLLERKGGNIIKAHWYIWVALVLFAVSAVMDKALVTGHKTHPLVVLFYQHAVFLLMYAVLFFWKKKPLLNLFTHEHRSTLVLIIFVAVLTLGYRYAQLAATQLAPVALVLAVKRTSVFFASLVGGKLFSEQRLPWKLVGAALIIVAGFLILRAVG